MSLPLSLCKKCGKPIYWVVTEKGANMPVDNYPSDNGNIIFINRLAHVLKKDEPVPDGAKRYKSHYATCPHAGHSRNPNGANMANYIKERDATWQESLDAIPTGGTMMTPCRRRCWQCGNVADHEDNIIPHVRCKLCGSQDTRLVKTGDMTPLKPGYYWAMWRQAAQGTHEGDQLTPSDKWEIVEVWENFISDPCEADKDEKFGVSVPGVRETQWIKHFKWGGFVADPNSR